MDRIEILRKEALQKDRFSYEFYYHYIKSHTAQTADEEYERYSNAFYDAFSALTPSISDGELIVGKYAHPMSPEQEAEWQDTYQSLWEQYRASAGNGQNSHMAIDYDLLLAQGICGIQERIDGYLLSCPPEKKPFYQACKHCLEAVLIHAEHYARTALTQAELAKDPERRRELLEIASICRKVPSGRAHV